MSNTTTVLDKQENEYIALVDAAIAEFNERDWKVFGELHAEDILLTAPSLPTPATDREQVKAWAKGLADTFSDLKWTKLSAFNEGNRVAVEILAEGTHDGDLKGPGGKVIPATQNKVIMKIGGFFTADLEKGQVTKVSLYNDLLSLLGQIGAF